MYKDRIRVLLVEDSPSDRKVTCLALMAAVRPQFEVIHAGTLVEAIDVLREEHPDVILLDLGLPDSEGPGGLEALRRENSDVPIIILTGNTDQEIALHLLDNGAQDHLIKNVANTDELSRAIRYAIQRQQLVRALTSAKQLLERKNQRLAALYKTAHNFVDNVSHEFRTPLTVIKEFASLLHEGIVQDPAEHSHMLEVIGDRADDLNTMVDDMLDVSRLESGLLGVSRRNHDVKGIIDQVMFGLQRKAAVARMSLQVEVDNDLPAVYCDAEKVSRILINLSVNAIKFCSEPGLVQVWARYDTDGGGVLIGVTDNGPGIDQESLTAIFERFRQLDSDCRSSTKGFGLGLSIAKELVDLNFGTMMVESELGAGSTFSFNLPPANPLEVMRRYVPRIAQLRNGETTLSLVEATIDDDIAAEIGDELDSLLIYMLRRNDLIFRVTANRWLLVLPVSEEELVQFVARVQESLKDTNRNRPDGPLPQLNLQSLGIWPLATEQSELMDRFAQVIGTAELTCTS